MAVPEGHLHGRVFGSAHRAARPRCPGLSAGPISRLKALWQHEHARWERREVGNNPYVYLWVDGIHFGVRLEEANQCIRVVIGATADGKKELLALTEGFRESEQSWKDVLLDLQRRGLTIDPKLAIGDGAVGFWKALPQVFGTTRGPRCWVHKTVNLLNKLPKHLQLKAKGDLHQIWMAATREQAYAAFEVFVPHLRASVSESGRGPGEGPRRAARLLGLSGRALASPSYPQPD